MADRRSIRQAELTTDEVLAASSGGRVRGTRMIAEIAQVDVEAGRLYICTLNGERYRALRLVRHAHSLQRLVVYEGLTGEDAGKGFACPLLDWHKKFRRAVVEAPIEKQVGGYHRGLLGGEI